MTYPPSTEARPSLTRSVDVRRLQACSREEYLRRITVREARRIDYDVVVLRIVDGDLEVLLVKADPRLLALRDSPARIIDREALALGYAADPQSLRTDQQGVQGAREVAPEGLTPPAP